MPISDAAMYTLAKKKGKAISAACPWCRNGSVEVAEREAGPCPKCKRKATVTRVGGDVLVWKVKPEPAKAARAKK